MARVNIIKIKSHFNRSMLLDLNGLHVQASEVTPHHCLLLNSEVCLACHLSNVFLLKMASNRGVMETSRSNDTLSNRHNPTA